MSFGLQVTGNDVGGDFTITDTDQNLVNYIVSHYGVGSTVDVSDISGLDYLIFVRNSTSGEIICIDNSPPTSVVFVKPDNTLNGAPVTVEYMIAVDVSGLTPSPDTYGLQIFTSTGAVAFDSRGFLQNKNFSIVEYVEPHTIDGSDSIISTDVTLFTEIGKWSYFNGSDPFEANYSGVEYTSSSMRHWDLEVDEEIGTIYWDNYSTILLADVYP